jgi:hypothetical protein
MVPPQALQSKYRYSGKTRHLAKQRIDGVLRDRAPWNMSSGWS